MRYLIAAMAVLPFASVLLGMLTGKVRVRSCCAVDPSRDLRMRDVAAHAPVRDCG